MRVPDLIRKKERGEKIVMLTAYDASMARILDRAGVDALLVGDSAGMVMMGHATTLPVTLEAMILFTECVARATHHALVVADLPFLTYQTSVADAVRNAGALLQKGGAAAVKLEGGHAVADVVKRLTEVGIPVMGHLGLMPQSVHATGGFRRQATSAEAQQRLLEEAQELEAAGAFAVVLESIPEALAEAVTKHLRIPTIGIGAGPHCDGQVLVTHDLVGLSGGRVPPFARQYAALGEALLEAARAYAGDVRAGILPEPAKAAHVKAAPGAQRT